ncbi:Gluconolactonase [Geodia barretti]|uniref:Gluconolactonase n=1 Tax=Geodia barretti TaxID=519541 RepID=A0AA35X0D4_GEOBA|nr:Gluconolactonase [Geodia barretti]
MPVQQLSPELERIVSQDQAVEVLGTGYVIAEGPLWWSEEQYLLFSEVRGNRRWKWTASEGLTLVQEPTNNANGLTRDPQGRLVMCEGGARRVTRVEHDGSVTVIANSYHGRPLNRPNDVVVKSDGSIYFTDPGGPSPDTGLDFSGVYRVSADLSTINLLVRDYVLPNGLAFSPDESVLYINDSQGVSVDIGNMFRSTGRIDAFDVRPTGMLANRRVFCELRGEMSGIPDGMKVDVEGNVYCTGPGGVWIVDSAGMHLGTILTEVEHTTNMAWGGEDWKTLFITTADRLARIQLKVSGLPVPTQSS